MIGKLAAVCGLALTAILGGAFGTWVSDRESPTAVLRVETSPAVLQPGGTLEIRYFVRRIRSCAIVIDRVLYDSKGVRTPLEDRNFIAAPGPLGDDSYVVAVNLPETFAPGRGRYRATSAYRCNPWHNWFPIMVQNPDIYFEVAPAAEKSSRRAPQPRLADSN